VHVYKCPSLHIYMHKHICSLIDLMELHNVFYICISNVSDFEDNSSKLSSYCVGLVESYYSCHLYVQL
jgi:hypothetical protein